MSIFQDMTQEELDQRRLLRVDSEALCFHCGQMTQWTDIDFQGYLCVPKCQDAKITEFNKALRAEETYA